VILVGEMRDLDDLATALLAAETGHMVFSTLHTWMLRRRFSASSRCFPASKNKFVFKWLALRSKPSSGNDWCAAPTKRAASPQSK